jgi:hypothetical protein
VIERFGKKGFGIWGFSKALYNNCPVLQKQSLIMLSFSNHKVNDEWCGLL